MKKKILTEEERNTIRSINLVSAVADAISYTQYFRDHIKINCLFHNEKTPSLAIYEDHYYCFSCGEHGDQIDWVMKTKNLNFNDAVQLLLDYANENG